MHFDEIVHKIGEFGTFQRRLYMLLVLPCVTVGSSMLMVVLILYTPEHRCKIPGLDNDTFAVQDAGHQAYTNRSIPPSSDETKSYDQCHVYSGETVDPGQPVNASLETCNEWVYDETVFVSTFTSKDNLVCDDAMKISHIQMLYYFGVLVGDLVFGVLADLIGRKKALYLAIVSLLVSSVSVTWAPGFVSFSILEFIVGASAHGAMIVVFVISMEIVGPTKRVWTGMLIQVLFAIGVLILAGVGFALRRYMWINLVCMLPTVFYLSYWWLVPESPRWLISKGRYEEAKAIIVRAAAVNKKDVPATMLEAKTSVKKDSHGHIWHIVKSPVLLRRMLILYFNWMVVSMTYYGVSMNISKMGGNFFLNFFLVSFAEIPGILIGIAFLDRIGRRYTNSGSMCIGGLACLSTIFTVLYGGPELQPLTIALAFLGKMGASCAFGVVYVFTAEILPTVMRNGGMGSASCFARIGSMTAPYIAKSGELIGGKFGIVEPLMIFGVLSIIAGLLLLLLPETYNQKLPDTVDEANHFGQRKPSKPIADEEIELPFIQQ